MPDAEKTIYCPGAATLFDRIRDLRAATGMGFREALTKARQELDWEYIFDTQLRMWRWRVKGEE